MLFKTFETVRTNPNTGIVVSRELFSDLCWRQGRNERGQLIPKYLWLLAVASFSHVRNRGQGGMLEYVKIPVSVKTRCLHASCFALNPGLAIGGSSHTAWQSCNRCDLFINFPFPLLNYCHPECANGKSASRRALNDRARYRYAVHGVVREDEPIQLMPNINYWCVVLIVARPPMARYV